MAAIEQAPLPICELSPYQTKWVIKARVTEKSVLRTFSRNGNDGKVFSAVLLDASGGDIRASFFNVAAEKYFNMLDVGQCFTFSRGTMKVANRQYNTTSHRYELTFDRDSIVEKCENVADIKAVKYSFVNLRSLHDKSLPCVVDLCGIVTSFQPALPVTGKQGEVLTKREITIADDSATSMIVTLWGERAWQEDAKFDGKPVLALKSVSIREFQGGRNGSLLQSGSIAFDPSEPEAKRLQEWWSNGGSSQQMVEISSRGIGGADGARARNAKQTTLAGLRLAATQLSSQAEIFMATVRLALVQFRRQGEPIPFHYMACQEPKEGSGYPCNKRVDEHRFCASCNRDNAKTAPRLNVRCAFVDAEDQSYMTVFHEAASKVLGMSAEEVCKLEEAAKEKGEAGREELETMVRKKYFETPIRLTVRGKIDTYNGESRPNFSVIDARPVSYAERGRELLKEVTEMLGHIAHAGA